MLNEAHTAHVCRELEDRVGSLAGHHACIAQHEVRNDVLYIIEALKPLIDGLDVDCTNLLAVAAQGGNETASNEASATCDDEQRRCHDPYGQGFERRRKAQTFIRRSRLVMRRYLS